jgi:transcriptional regulator with XRE-family HTH domain
MAICGGVLGGAMDEQALGKRLQLARRRAGLTQQELCQKAGLSYSTLAKIERGAIKSPSVFTVAAIAGATNTPLEELLDVHKGVGFPAPVNTKKRSKTGVTFVYFDVNGVLVRFFHRAFTAIAYETGKSSDIIETLFWRFNNAVCKGEMTMDQLNGEFAKELGIDSFDWKSHYFDNVEAMPGAKELVEWAAEHYEIGLLSDSMPGFIDELKARKLIPDANYTSVMDSSKVKTLKSEEHMYEVAQQLASVDNKEIMLIDDSRANLILADRAGWHVMWFNDFEPDESIDRARVNLEF